MRQGGDTKTTLPENTVNLVPVKFVPGGQCRVMASALTQARCHLTAQHNQHWANASESRHNETLEPSWPVGRLSAASLLIFSNGKLFSFARPHFSSVGATIKCAVTRCTWRAPRGCIHHREIRQCLAERKVLGTKARIVQKPSESVLNPAVTRLPNSPGRVEIQRVNSPLTAAICSSWRAWSPTNLSTRCSAPLRT